MVLEMLTMASGFIYTELELGLFVPHLQVVGMDAGFQK